jgi:hypothetical protein
MKGSKDKNVPVFKSWASNMQWEWESYCLNQLVQSGVRHFGNINQPGNIPHQVQQTHHNAKTLICKIKGGGLLKNKTLI